MKIRFIFFIVTLFYIAGCSRERQEVIEPSAQEATVLSSEACLPPAKNPEPVDISTLISEPSRFEGKPVIVSGYYYSRFEQSAIYPSQRDPQNSDWSDGLWLSGLSPFSEFSDKHITVSGVFTRKEKGHLGQWPASICVSSVVLQPLN
jgi:hypothetical protein